MAFTGVHIVFGKITPVGTDEYLIGKAKWSETMVGGSGTTANAASVDSDNDTKAFLVQPAFDIFVSIGPAPNANASPRYLVRGGESTVIPCKPLDKLNWVVA